MDAHRRDPRLAQRLVAARDPLRDDAKPVKLSELTAKIYAVRVIKKAV